jgi:serine/threonine-protein kinase HipA
MTTIARVDLWGTTIGAVSLGENEKTAAFEYDPSFLRSHVEVSPLKMPLDSTIYRFPELPFNTFHGLPGLLADSLPDKFGNALIDTWLASLGRQPESFNSVERLCYIGSRGIGALEFFPNVGPKQKKSEKVQIDALVGLASDILSRRSDLKTTFEQEKKSDALAEILRIGTSFCGIRVRLNRHGFWHKSRIHLQHRHRKI